MKFYRLLIICLLYLSSITHSLQHAKSYEENINIDITKYFVSEKLDGLRGYWDGEKLRSKNGNVYQTPQWFIENLGTKPLDGELWIGYESFEKTLSIVSRLDNDADWYHIKYMIFDMPNENMPFKKRVDYMNGYVSSLGLKHVQIIPQQRLKNDAELNDLLALTTQKGGEGLMLHHEDAYYGSGSVNHLLKLKAHNESIGKVIGYTKGKGKYVNSVGSLKVELDDGMIINIGSGLTDTMRNNPPDLGTLIVFKYNGLTVNGKPRFARFKKMKNLDLE